MPKHNKKTLRRSRKKGRKNEKKTRKNIKKGGSKKIYKFTTTITDLERMKNLIGIDNAEKATNTEKYSIFTTFEDLTKVMDVNNIRITEYKYRNNLRIKNWRGKVKDWVGDDTDAHYGMYQKVIDDTDLKKRIIAMFAVILNYKNKDSVEAFSSTLIQKYNSIKDDLNENNDKSLYWMVEYKPNNDEKPRQLEPGEIITKKNIFMFQFMDHGLIKSTPGFRFSILREGKTAFSKEKSERPDDFKTEMFNRLYTFPTAKIEYVTL